MHGPADGGTPDLTLHPTPGADPAPTGRPAPEQDPLFNPLRVGAWDLPHRVVMAPLTRSRARQPGDVPTELNATYYGQRAGAALIISEATQISPQGKGYTSTPGLHDDEQVAGWRLVTEAVHREGGLILAQLWHVGRISHPSFQPEGAPPVAPSALRPEGQTLTDSGPAPFVTPRALDTEELPGLVDDYRRAATRAREAGFDGVEIHAANGYLLDQFLRDGTNQRTDAYGGSLGNRARFPVEVTEAVADALGPDRVGVRISPTGTFNTMSDSDPDATFGHFAERLAPLGLAYLHVVEDLPGFGAEAGPPFDGRALRRAFGGVTMANGGYDGHRARQAIQEHRADLISFGRPFIANPDLPLRLRLGARLAEADPATFYGGGAEGYTDYPFLGR